MKTIIQKLADFKKHVGSYTHVAVGFSGGVDSTLLLYLLSRMVKVTAITATGIMQTPEEREFTRRFAASLPNVDYVEVAVNPLELTDFYFNTLERCYACKKMIFSQIQRVASERGAQVIFDGSNVDDLGDYRPGMRALSELGVESPLLKAGFEKSDIYYLSKKYDLPTKNSPSAACLASRIATGETITEEKLEQIAKGERFLRTFGFSQLRLRLKNNRYYLECARSDFELFYNNRKEILSGLKARNIILDDEPREYKRGSMNETDAT